jgi:nitroreductase
MDIINNRRSVRLFTDIQVEKAKIELLLRAGMQAPSANNVQPWTFLVVQDKKSLEQLSTISRPLKTATLAILLFDKIDGTKPKEMYYGDMGAATQNILLEAANIGLGGCWVGINNRSSRIDTVLETFNIPNDLQPFSLIALGYPEDENANYFIDRYNKDKIYFERF